MSDTMELARTDILVGKEIALRQYDEIRATPPAIAGNLRLKRSIVDEAIARLLRSGIILYAGKVWIDGKDYNSYVIATRSEGM